jgi:hypothetical protein
MPSIADQNVPGERKRAHAPAVPPLDLTPTGRLPHVVAAYRTDTTARTALAALDAALILRKATQRLANLYGTEPVFQVGRHRAHMIISPRDGHPVDRIETLAGDVALLVDADLHPDIDPDDLSMVLTGTGVHGIDGVGALGVWISAPVPPLDVAEGGGQ